MNSFQQESVNNLGLFWEKAKHDFSLPRVESIQTANFLFKKNRTDIVWNALATLENNPATLAQTETILSGMSVSGLSVDELFQIKRFGEACLSLYKLIDKNYFSLSEKIVCDLHKIAAREEALTWGEFRTRQVHIHSVAYIPPPAEELENISRKGFSFLSNEISDDSERAIVAFLFLCRTQFFFDGNKRSAMLMMNGELIKNRIQPLIIPHTSSEVFHKRMRDFYNSGNATAMISFIKNVGCGNSPEEIGASQL